MPTASATLASTGPPRVAPAWAWPTLHQHTHWHQPTLMSLPAAELFPNWRCSQLRLPCSRPAHIAQWSFFRICTHTLNSLATCRGHFVCFAPAWLSPSCLLMYRFQCRLPSWPFPSASGFKHFEDMQPHEEHSASYCPDCTLSSFLSHPPALVCCAASLHCPLPGNCNLFQLSSLFRSILGSGPVSQPAFPSTPLL